MNTRNIAIASFKALALSVLAFSAQAAEFVTNGGFEATTSGAGQLGYNTNATGWSVPDPNAAASYTFLFTPGLADTTGATGQYGNLQLWGPGNGGAVGNNLPATSPAGGNYVAEDGAFQVGAVSQTINGLVVGQSYSLSFWFAGAQQQGFTGATTEGFQVSLGGVTQDTAILNNADHGFTGWQQKTFNYTATSATEVLSFLAVGTPNGLPPFTLLDGVSLTGPAATTTPLPAALFFVAPALAGVFGFARRKQNKA